jgi:hypothetical protein
LPIELPDGEWARTLRTTWVEPGYLETDASWCVPGGEPATALANGGAFGGKATTEVGGVARRLADEHGRPVRVLLAREDAVRWGPKRPPLAAGLRADGSGVVRVARTPGIAGAIATAAPGLEVEEVDVAGPPTSAAVRAAGWAEAAVLEASLGTGPDTVRSPDGAEATAAVDRDGRVAVSVRCGRPLDAVVLRSYCIGAAHMALGWVRSEGLAESMSRYLIRRIEESPNITLHTRTQITALDGGDRLERVAWRSSSSDHAESHEIEHVFLMTGAVPNTMWLKGCVALDEKGFVRTGSDLRPEDLASIPVPLREELENAVISLNAERIMAAVSQVSAHDATLGNVLRRMAGKYQYTSILDALRRCKKSSTEASA